MTTENEKMTTALAVRESALPMRGLDDLVKAGELLASSRMFGALNPAAGFIVVATCQQQGISLMEFNRTYHIIEGKPSMRADAMLAEFRKRGGKVRIIENTVTRAAAEFTFDGNKNVFEFTLEDAKRTGDCLKSDGKMKDIWNKRADDMLWARMVSRAVRRLCPEINAGLYAPEEVQDFDDRQQRVDAAPVALSSQDAAARAKPVVATVEAAMLEPVIDFSVCPVGGDQYEGHPWSEFPDEMLQAVFDSDESAITDGHRAAIRSVIDARKDGVISVANGVKRVYAIGTPKNDGELGMWWGPSPNFKAAMEQHARSGDHLVELSVPSGDMLRVWVRSENATWDEMKGGAA